MLTSSRQNSPLVNDSVTCRFIKEDVLCQTALLYNATGRHHFAAAVREYRALISGRVGNGFPRADQTLWTDVRYEFGWTAAQINSKATTTGGYPLGMKEAVAREIKCRRRLITQKSHKTCMRQEP